MTRMADLVVPELGESITEAIVAKWLKRAGDTVENGEMVAELETSQPNSRDFAGALNNLAQLYGDVGRDGEAEPIYTRAIAITPMTSPHPSPGWVSVNPRRLASFWVPLTWVMFPTA